MVTDEQEVAKKMNNYFIDVIENLDIESFIEQTANDDNSFNSIEDIVKKYNQHPNILKIKQYVTIDDKFTFFATIQQFQAQIESSDPKKVTIENDIPSKILIATNEISPVYLTKIYNDSKDVQNFPDSLKYADVTPIQKKDEKTTKVNDRPVSLFPTISKIFERDMYNQINIYIEKRISPYLFGFRKGHSTDHCLNVMIERWKRALD